MADLPPNNPMPGAPMGAEPLKKSTGKVQPKKETVRINLPPKPTAAPTIKLPTLPPGGPTGAPSAVGAPQLVRPAPPTAAAPAAAAAPPTKGAAPAAAAGAQRPAPMTRPAAPLVPALKTIDKVLIYSAVVASLVAVGFSAYVMYFVLKPVLENFQS